MEILKKLYDFTWGKFIFAGAYDAFLKRAEEAGLSEERRKVVSQASGRTLEIATGTGLNFPHYPSAVTELVLSEFYPPMLEVLQRKVANSVHDISVVKADAENLPFPDSSFDTVVATMILCSTPKPSRVLQEINRVLRPGGTYLFLEHIRNPDPKIAQFQDRIQPGWYLFGNGCHCNRDTIKTISQSPLVIDELNHGKIPKAWSILEYMITGRAHKSEKSNDLAYSATELVGKASSSDCGCSSQCS